MLRLLRSRGARRGFDVDAEAVVSERLRSRRASGWSRHRWRFTAGLRLWGVFDGGETCWWLPVSGEPDEWPVVLLDADGLGWQRLPYGAWGFLDQWLDGRLDLPVLSVSAVPRPRVLYPPGIDPAAPATTEATTVRERPGSAPGAGDDHGEPRTGGRTYDSQAIERSLGLWLPSDYKRLFEVYGTIGINAASRSGSRKISSSSTKSKPNISTGAKARRCPCIPRQKGCCGARTPKAATPSGGTRANQTPTGGR